MKRSHLLTTVALIAIASPALAVEKAEVLNTYVDIASAAYGDSLVTAQRLQTAVKTVDGHRAVVYLSYFLFPIFTFFFKKEVTFSRLYCRISSL